MPQAILIKRREVGRSGDTPPNHREELAAGALRDHRGPFRRIDGLCAAFDSVAQRFQPCQLDTAGHTGVRSYRMPRNCNPSDGVVGVCTTGPPTDNVTSPRSVSPPSVNTDIVISPVSRAGDAFR